METNKQTDRHTFLFYIYRLTAPSYQAPRIQNAGAKILCSVQVSRGPVTCMSEIRSLFCLSFHLVLFYFIYCVQKWKANFASTVHVIKIFLDLIHSGAFPLR